MFIGANSSYEAPDSITKQSLLWCSIQPTKELLFQLIETLWLFSLFSFVVSNLSLERCMQYMIFVSPCSFITNAKLSYIRNYSYPLYAHAHSSFFFRGDESGSGRGGCSGFFRCYNTKRRKKGKVKCYFIFLYLS